MSVVTDVLMVIVYIVVIFPPTIEDIRVLIYEFLREYDYGASIKI